MALSAKVFDEEAIAELGEMLKNEVKSFNPIEAVNPPPRFIVGPYTNSIIPDVSCKLILKDPKAVALTLPPFPKFMESHPTDKTLLGAVPETKYWIEPVVLL